MACCLDQGFEQSPVDGIPVEEKLRMPLYAQKESMAWRLDRLDDSIRGSRTGHEGRCDGLDRLVMRAVDLDAGLPDHPAEHAGRCNRDGMRQPGGWRDLAVRKGVLRLGPVILKEGTPERHVHGLHPPAYSQSW